MVKKDISRALQKKVHIDKKLFGGGLTTPLPPAPEGMYLEKCSSHCLAKQSNERFLETSFKLVNEFSAFFNFMRVAANHRHDICERSH